MLITGLALPTGLATGLGGGGGDGCKRANMLHIICLLINPDLYCLFQIIFTGILANHKLVLYHPQVFVVPETNVVHFHKFHTPTTTE